jgi:ribosomal protein L32
MDIGVILIGFAVLVLCLPLLAKPFLKDRKWAQDRIQEPASSEQSQTLKERRQNILYALRELDFDFQTGKVIEQDHRALRARLMAEAAWLIPNQLDADDEIESLIQARRESLGKTTKCSQCGGYLTDADRFCPKCGTPYNNSPDKAVDAICLACGSKTVPGALFCSRCGSRLASQVALVSND